MRDFRLPKPRRTGQRIGEPRVVAIIYYCVLSRAAYNGIGLILRPEVMTHDALQPPQRRRSLLRRVGYASAHSRRQGHPLVQAPTAFLRKQSGSCGRRDGACGRRNVAGAKRSQRGGGATALATPAPAGGCGGGRSEGCAAAARRVKPRTSATPGRETGGGGYCLGCPGRRSRPARSVPHEAQVAHLAGSRPYPWSRVRAD